LKKINYLKISLTDRLNVGIKKIKMKKVIFIGGTSYSGSTLLDMILANDPTGFSCGEVVALFQPWREHHIEPICGCGNPYCDLWKIVQKAGKENLYNTIFNLYPSVNFIVDSSKNQFWIKEQTQRLVKQDIDVKNVLIWKSPFDLAASYKKRNRLKDWERSVLSYYRVYFSLIDNFHPVSYKELAKTTSQTLQNICNTLGIEYFEQKSHYWEKDHHTLFGNNSAKVHLYSKDSSVFSNTRNKLVNSFDTEDANTTKNYKSIYYNVPNDPDLKTYIRNRLEHRNILSKVYQILEYDHHAQPPRIRKLMDEVKLPKLSLHLMKIVRGVRNSIRLLKNKSDGLS